MASGNTVFSQSNNFEIEESKERQLIKKANYAEREGNILIALEFYKKLVELKSDKTIYHFKIANLYRALNDYKSAEAAYLKVITY